MLMIARRYKGRHYRPFQDCRDELERAFPAELPLKHEPSNGEVRLMAEVLFTILHCRDVPTYAHQRAFDIAEMIAEGAHHAEATALAS